MNRPLVSCIWLWLCGYAAAHVLELNWLSLYVSVGLGITAIIWWSARAPWRIGVCALLLVGISAGYYESYDRGNTSKLLLPSIAKGADEAAVKLEGIITSRVEVDGDKASFTLTVERLVEQAVAGEAGNTSNAIETGSAEGDTVAIKEAAPSPSINEPVAVTVKLLTREEQQTVYGWQRADRVVLNGTAKAPQIARNYEGFDYRAYLRLQHIHWIVAVKGLAAIQASAPEQWTWQSALRWNDEFRLLLGQRIADIFPAQQGGFMKSMLIGLTDDMDPLQFQQFSQLGLTHILAVSGLNVAVFLACLLWVLRKFRCTRETCLLTAIALMPLYIALTGGSPSIVRAGLMAMIALYTAYRHTLKDGLHTVLLVGFLMLLWEPYYLMDVSFQLSFLVTIGLIIGVPPVNKLLPIQSPMLKGAFSISLVAQCISFPVSIYYFNQLSLLSLAANLCLVPVFSMVTMPAGTAALVVSFIYRPAGQAIAWVVAQVNDWVFVIVDLSSRWDAFQTIWASPTITWMAGYYLALASMVWGLLRIQQEHTAVEGPMLHAVKPNGARSKHSNTPSKGNVNGAVSWNWILNWSRSWIGNWKARSLPLPLACVSLLALFLYAYNPDRWKENGEGYVDFIDVGQGDSIMIRSPISRQIILIDGGGTLTFTKPGEEWKLRKDPFEVGKKLLVPLLKKRGVQRIDYLVISHQDADHIGGLQAVLEQIPVKQLIFNGTFKPGIAVEKLFQTALDKQVELVKVTAGNSLQVDPLTKLMVLHPIAEPFADVDDVEQRLENKMDSENEIMLENAIRIEKEQNGQSVVLMMDMAGTKWLFTGDMDQTSETAVAQMAAGLASFPTDGAAPPVPLANLLPMQQGSVDVLKVAHHGSKTSTSNTWLQAYQPKLAVISAGANNTYGHPHPLVVERLQQHGAQILRTDQMGEVQMIVRDGQIRIRTKLE
ncbi:ComEC/Rec2 family competence protein [Paenibacillus agricola]|uniref:ComEC/Rec2 family competence protein n=1 Tax=Paenibacillus agricola TaxID=2716264 RepID=UPI00289321A3|nr:ComEC/Rec2 family competence protein [Paenibacillus agricola]